ncbi:hypothetical protein NDA11_003887 [Ustilago hordei]|uniref:Uncharacterized protein n=1 Tax=Ustilago hordei TaxID=120017 RepID=I2FPP0_USTHO|nr:uncharacterized protein UHO2_04650 [Ustilago hordei]KAJ1041681.1 hypothetical protein NDA10_003493 [Ustilago hordei]KAJ1575379.1 hypothetical protein NDA15_000803 [Ustilago hordei]KAJ1577225.1 hypothetical protein NDA12_003074 [Ustilago hordei]KAJ1595164.1 hypothetical protein NDA11_003887 [Ustilago hordei]KAJ1596977.1 hypothetical protein NDA14_002394 [Ustilago hordei]
MSRLGRLCEFTNESQAAKSNSKARARLRVRILPSRRQEIEILHPKPRAIVQNRFPVNTFPPLAGLLVAAQRKIRASTPISVESQEHVFMLQPFFLSLLSPLARFKTYRGSDRASYSTSLF